MDLTGYDDVDLTAEERVAKFVLEHFRVHHAWEFRDHHLVKCPDATIKHVDGSNGFYGCETGCEYARLEAEITCPHALNNILHTYGEFGNLAELIEEIGPDASQ